MRGARFMKPVAKVGRCQEAGTEPKPRTTSRDRSSQPLKGYCRPSASVHPSRWSHQYQERQPDQSLQLSQHSCAHFSGSIQDDIGAGVK